RALQGNEQLPDILITFYDLYCKGYSFLDNIGIGYGLEMELTSSLPTPGRSTKEYRPLIRKLIQTTANETPHSTFSNSTYYSIRMQTT
ncbi:MAG: hypothetical protein J7621_30090, partial [Niastella sp.]|nr:hypothetical protein [Niastella sp.]